MMIEIISFTLLFLSWLIAVFVCEVILAILVIANTKSLRIKVIEISNDGVAHEKENHF